MRISRVEGRRSAVGLVVVGLLATLLAWTAGVATSAPAGAAEMNVAVVVESDGTAPFRDLGTLGAHDPGDDIDDDNGIVRTLDRVLFRVDYSLNEPDDSNPILTLNLPAGVAFTAGYTPPTGQGGCDGPNGFQFNPTRTQLICDLGIFPINADSETIALVVSVTPAASFPSGTSFQLTANLADGVGTPSDATSPPIEVSSAPNFNIFKRNDFTVTGVNGPNPGMFAPPVADQQGGVDGFRLNFAVGINGFGGDGRGLAPLAEPVVIRDFVDSSAWPAGIDGVRLLGCSGTADGSNDRWPTNVATVTQPDRQVRQSTVACTQGGGDGTPIDISLTDIDFDRTAAPPIRSGSGAAAVNIAGMVTYVFVQTWISYADWVAIGHHLGTVSPQQSTNNPVQEVGSVSFPNRLHGPAGIPVSNGTCNTSAGWIAPANVNVADPSTWDPNSPGGASNLGSGVESATDNGACARRTINLLPPNVPATGGPSSFDFDVQKFSITPDTRFGIAVAPEAQITTGMQLQVQATWRNPDDPVNQPAAMTIADGSLLCDNWDNSLFGPDPDLGEEWIVPDDHPSVEDYEEFHLDYPEGVGFHYEYGRGNWGTHNPDRESGFYNQGRSGCADVPSTASGPNDRPSYLLPLQDGGSVYWATENQVDFTNGGGGLIDIDDVNAVRVVLDVPMQPMLPSNAARFEPSDFAALTTENTIFVRNYLRLRLNWQNHAGAPVPSNMRNYFNRLFSTEAPNSIPAWANPRAQLFDDGTQTAPLDPYCGSPCGQNAFIGNQFFSLWWQVLGPDVNVAKARIGPATVAPGSDVSWRLRAAGEAPIGTPPNTPGTTPNVTIDDVLPVGLEYVPGSTVSTGTVNVGEPAVLEDTPAAGQTTLRWTVAALPWGSVTVAPFPFEVTFDTTTSPFLSNESYTNTMSASGTSFDGNRNATAPVSTSQAAAIGVLNKSVEPELLQRGDEFEYSLDYGNPGTLPFDTFDAIDILPWNQDQAHDRRSQFQDGAIELLDVLPSTRNEVAWVSTVPPAVLDAADGGTLDDTDGFLDPADAAALGSAQWPCTWADTEAGTPGCPAIADVTALRFVGSGTPFLPSNTGPFTITLQYRTTNIADPGNVFDNSWVARFGDLTFPVYRPIPIPPVVIVPPFALGNQVWIDSNGNSLRDPGEAVVLGVTVNLLNAAGDTVLDTTTTDGNGLYVFDELDPGTYRVEIDAANFAPGGPLVGLASSPGQANADGADNNDNGAPVGSGAVRSGPVTLGGDDFEPTGEDPTSTTVASDEYADLTVDFGFVRGIRIGNLVWADLDDDGVAEAGEPGIGGVTVQLIGDDGDGVFEPGVDSVEGTTVTGTDGAYWFTNVESGDYFIAVPGSQAVLASRRSSTGATGGLTTDNRDDGAPSAGYASVTSLLEIDATVDQPLGEAGHDGVVNDEDEANTGTGGSVADGRSNLTFDLGFFEIFAIGNQVWRDTNDNGLREATEQPVPNVTVNLLDATGTTVLRTTTTDTNGLYVFDELAAGTYVVEVASSNFAVGAPLRGFRSSTGSTPTDGEDDNDAGEPVTNPGNTPTPTVAVRSVPVTLGGGTPEPSGEDPTSTTVATDDHADLTVDFGFRAAPQTACRGMGLRLGNIILAVANTPIRACLTVDPTFPSGLNFGSIPLPPAVGGLLGALLPAGSIGFNADGVRGVSYREIDRAAADSDTARVTVNLPGIRLDISGIRTEASATLGAGCARTLAGFSRIGQVKLNGLPLFSGTTAPVSLPLGIATLHLNQRVVEGDTITFRGVFLDLAGTATDLVVSESIAGISCTTP